MSRVKPVKNIQLEKATFGAGCFWGVEETFRNLKGVKETTVGFMGGKTSNPSYEQVCSGLTGHAEVVHITYDPNQISYKDLLEVFWNCHNPMTLNRQGPDEGTQYRSVIFYHHEAQKKIAEDSKTLLQKSGKFSRPIVTKIVSATPFYRAEEYHQQYLKKRGLSVCHI